MMTHFNIVQNYCSTVKAEIVYVVVISTWNLCKTAQFVSLVKSNLATFQGNDQEWMGKVGVSLIERRK